MIKGDENNSHDRRLNKVLLATPPYTLFKNDVRRAITPLGLISIAAVLEQNGYEVAILDISTEGYYNLKEDGDFVTYGLSEEEIKKRIAEFAPDVFGVSCIFSTQAENAKRTLELAKEVNPKIITITGGSHPTYALQDMLNCNFLDYVILGEGELPTLQLLESLNNGLDTSNIGGVAYKRDNEVRINNNSQFIKDLDELPMPALHLLNMEKYFEINIPQNPYPKGKRVAQIMTSRGCSAKCIFCTTTNFWGNRYRGRSAQSVVNEIRYLKENYNIDEIQFTDDNFTLNKKRAIEILEGIKSFNLHWCTPQGIAVWALDEEIIEKMKETGCYQLTFAIESGNQEVLNKIIKKPLDLKKVKPLVDKAKSLGIKIHAFFICGMPGEKIEQMYETYNFAKDCGFDSASFFLATPLVGSKLLEVCQEKGYLREGMTCNDHLYKIGNIQTPDFDSKEVEELVEQFNRDYNKKDTREKRFEQWKY